MKKIFFILSVLCVSLLTSGVSYASKLNVNFFAHNSPTLEQFQAAKTRMDTLIDSYDTRGFRPLYDVVRIGIAPRAMTYENIYGNIIWANGVLYVSSTASVAELSGALSNYYRLNSVRYLIAYHSYYNATLAQMVTARDNIENTLGRITAAGLSLHLPTRRFIIRITPRAMSDGSIVVSDGKIYISSTASNEDLERFFMYYVR